MDDLSRRLQIELARTVFDDEYAELRNARLGPAPFAYRQPDEVLRHAHENLIATSKQTDGQPRYRKIVVAAGSKHSSNKVQSELTPEPVGKLRLGCANRGNVLMAQIWARPCRTSALQLLVQDLSGWVVPVSIYHASAILEKQCRIGVKLLIREPWLKESRDGYYIRVDSPSDVDIWPTSSYAPVNHLDVKARLNAARTQGASCFVKGDFVGAINAYEEGLLACRGRRQPDAAVEETIVHLNAAAAYLKLGLPGKAMSHMKQCRVDDLNDKQKQKHVYRKASALYNLGLHRECHVFLSTEVDVQDASSAEIAQLRDAASQRRYEALSGKYDWSFLYTQLEKGNSPDMADYTGPVQIQQIAGKENGLIAAEKAKPGDLLLVCNPIAVAGNGTPITNSTLGINCMTKELSTPSVMQVIETLYDKMRDWHGTGAKLRSMFAGIDFKRSAYTPSGDFNRTDGFLNAGQVEALVTRNAFRPRCITTALVEEDADTVQRSERDQIDKLTASCGLYHLPSMINHSCIGNATFYFFESVIVVRATRNIEKGEEILFSYCDSTQTIAERTQALAHHGFRCSCKLCEEDSALGQAALASANNRLKQMTHGNCSEMAIMSLIKDFKELFGPQRTTPCYPLCHCYRLLSDTLASSGRRQEQIEAAEIAALEALGAKVRKKNSANNEQTEHADERMILEDPLIALQEAVIGCLKLVALHKQAGKEDLARAWMREAGRLHDLECGPDIFQHRMKLFFDE